MAQPVEPIALAAPVSLVPVAPQDGGQDGHFLRDVFATYGTRVANLSLSVITGIMTARMLGPTQRGVFALVYLFASTVVTFGKMGLSQANVYSIRRDRVPPERVAANAIIVSLLWGGVLAVGAYAVRGRLLTTFLRGVPEWAVLISLPLIPVLLFESYFHAIVQAIGKFPLYNRRMFIGTVTLVASLFVFLVIFDGGLTAAILVVTINPIVMDTWLLVTVRRLIPFSLRLDRPLLWREIRFGLKSHVQVLAQHLHLRADVYLVAYFLDPAQVAFYVLAVRLAEFMLDIPRSIGMVMYPRLAALDDAAMYRMTAQACRRTLLMTITAAVGISLVAPTLIGLWYGQAYAPAGRPLPIVAAGIVSMSVLVMLTQSFTSRGKQQVNILVGAVALVGNLTLNVLLIPRFGIVGAGMASLASYSVAGALLIALFVRESGLSILDVLVPKMDDMRFFWSLATRGLHRGRRMIRTATSSAPAS